MKKSIFLSLTFLTVLAVSQLNAANLTEKGNVTNENAKEVRNVSKLSINSFYTDFGYLPDAQWEKTEDFDKATFILDGQKISAFYDSSNTLVGTTSFKTFADLPAKGIKNLILTYKNYNVGSVVYFNSNEADKSGRLHYGSTLNDEENYFVELLKENERIIVRINLRGDVSLYKRI